MSTIGDLKDVVGDYLQREAPSVVDSTLELAGEESDKWSLVNKLILRAANNARRRAERKHDFSWMDDTVEGIVPNTGKGIHLWDFYTVPSLSGTLVVTGGVGVLTMDLGGGGLNLAGKIPFKDGHTHMVFKDEASPAGFTTQNLACDEGGDLRDAWPTYNFASVGTIGDGTYEVSVRSADSSSVSYVENFRKIKTVHNVWAVDPDDDSEVALRFMNKQQLADRLLEHGERRTDLTLKWDFSTLIQLGNRMFLFPTNEDGDDVKIRIDACLWGEDYTEDDDSDEFLEFGFDYMMWAAVVEVNRLLRQFVPRQEGNLPPPIRERDEALEELIQMDIYQIQQGDATELE